VRVGLFKRLSSSGHSFILSLQRQRARNELFIHAIDNGLEVPLGSFTDHQFMVSDRELEDDDTGLLGTMEHRYDQLRDKLPTSTKWINSGVFKSTLHKDLLRDNCIITDMLDRFGTWDRSKDSKVNALNDLLQQQHAGEKVLIFTEYVDTADYIAKALKDAGVANVGLASGETENPAGIARRFSPESNKLPGHHDAATTSKGDPIDVLVATDVLSEGQNLQDSHIVVNYDLPWAIIRIIQRAGRVDRVGQRSDTVHVYMITHERVEQAIQLRQRIKQRLGAAAEAFGSDEQFFGSEDEVRILDELYKGVVADDLEAGDGEADAVSEASDLRKCVVSLS
jgi:SNF2 family DNA or RNA helicase